MAHQPANANSSAISHEVDEVALAEHAKVMQKNRRLRDRFFPQSLFADPAWDILLDLFVNQVEGRRISITSACIAADVPQTTGLRWITKLEELGLLIRTRCETDRRVGFVELAPEARRSMAQWIQSRFAAG